MADADAESKIKRWAQWHALAMLSATVASLVFGRIAAIVFTVVISFASLTFTQRRVLLQMKPLGGYANQLTALRLALLCVAALGIGSFDWREIFGLFLANVALDVLDGYVARKQNQVSTFGATFDREVDAVFVLVACLYFNLSLGVGLWILVPAILPYFYRAVVWALSDASHSDAKQTYAAWLAGINFALLLLAVAAPDSLRLTILLISTATVVFSFTISFYDLFRRRHAN